MIPLVKRLALTLHFYSTSMVSAAAMCTERLSTTKYCGASWFVFTILSLSMPGCSSPVVIAERYALAHNYTRLTVTGQAYTHVIYQKEQNSGKRWHIYIEGDGQPWIAQRFVAPDPTPKQPLMLRLMSQDPLSSIYLGRPCYHGMVSESNCNPWLWTHGRYSKQVVDSMVSALNKLIHSHQIKQITLIGHSGGGTLALLMAEQIIEADTVITIAGNLDVRAWTEKHAYTILRGSLNPAERGPLAEHIREYHFIGDKDRNIPQKATLQYVNKRVSACLTVMPDCAHLDCWEKNWAQILVLVAEGQACNYHD